MWLRLSQVAWIASFRRKCKGYAEVLVCSSSLFSHKLVFWFGIANHSYALFSALDSNQDGFVSYGKFRNFAVLLPKHRLQESVEPSMAWFESATMLPLGELLQFLSAPAGATSSPQEYVCYGNSIV